MGNPPISLTTGQHLRDRVFNQDRLGDRCNLEAALRLRQDTAVQGGLSNECNVGLDQENALHVRFCQHRDIARDLPEDVLWLCAAQQDHFLAHILLQVPRNLNDEDVAEIAAEGNITGEVDICGEGVDAGRQCYSTEDATVDIFPRGIIVKAPCGVGVRGLHVKDHVGQIPRSGRFVVRRVGLARSLTNSGIDLTISVRGIRSTRVHCQVEASNGDRVDGRDGDVACDVGGGNGGDTGLGDDREVFGISKVDRQFASDQQALSTSDGLGICRKREEGEENEEDASVGKEHSGLENVRK
jgi:hypothetical protein